MATRGAEGRPAAPDATAPPASDATIPPAMAPPATVRPAALAFEAPPGLGATLPSTLPGRADAPAPTGPPPSGSTFALGPLGVGPALATTLPPDPAAGPSGAGARRGGALAGPERGRRLGPGEVFPVAHWERYEFLGLLGRGGMGEVYEARDRRLGRAVALKFIRGAEPGRVMRLLQEARAQARIDHPNVCKVYEVGEVAGKAYIAMQLVRGQRLDEAALEMTLTAKVGVMRQVAEVVHEAHRLGVVHRDLKPANIMVDPADGGRPQPVVMDFGLAYEVSQGHGLTAAGALMGTPAYMAPEQARGDVQSVDRRSDVYSLGATLYELLAGAAPFAAATTHATLEKVLHEDPAPLRARAPHVPRDLETVTLKCLHKDPARRYDSARALAEDLQRYLDGEPILGRRPGLAERLGRRARKHRALVAVSALSLAVTFGLGAFGVRSWLEARRARAEAAGRARLAEGLGQQAKEIEWFLRAAYALPLHDATPEQRLVRARMARVAPPGGASGGAGEGLSHYALGRGHLALGEFEAARVELERARAMGVDTPALHYALGRALGELYHRAFEGARRSGGAEWAAGRRRGLEKQYLEPALAALAQSRGLELESPLYLEGLIALYRRDFDAAERAAERAAAETPWVYEARRLAGDVAYARATEQAGRGEREAARAGLERAASLYEQAVEVGRSDASTYEALAGAWLEHSELAWRGGLPPAPSLDRALAAADRAVVAAPLRAPAHTRRAQILAARYNALKSQAGADLGRALAEWQGAAERAVGLDARDVYAHETLGYAHFLRALREAREGRDPGPGLAEAVARLGEALALEPNYPWALNDLALVYRWRGTHLREHGGDPRADYAEAERHFRRAIASDPAYLFAYDNLGALYNDEASYALARGLDPEPEVVKALEADGRVLALDPQHHSTLNQQALAELTRAEYLVEGGGDPRPALARALERLERARAANPAFGRTSLHAAMAHRLAARHALREGGDPAGALSQGRAALAEAEGATADCVDCKVVGAQLGLEEAAWAGRRGLPALPALRRALAEARRAVEMYPYFEAHQERARACWRLAEALAPAEAAGALDEGEAQIELALRLDPNLAHAHALRGALALARARAAGDAGRRAELAGAARASLARALELNPLLRREYEGPLREAELGP